MRLQAAKIGLTLTFNFPEKPWRRLLRRLWHFSGSVARYALPPLHGYPPSRAVRPRR
jgi:hypothetical protein